MGWSTTAPSVKAWEQEQSTSFTANYYTITTKQSIGRTSGKGFAVKVEFTVSNGSYGSFNSPGKWVLTCTVNGSGSAYSTGVAIAKGTTTFYYTGEADAGATVKTATAAENVGTFFTLTFTAPKLLGGQFYVNVGGTWKEATMFVNVSGTWKEAQAKINVGGEWK